MEIKLTITKKISAEEFGLEDYVKRNELKKFRDKRELIKRLTGCLEKSSELLRNATVNVEIIERRK